MSDILNIRVTERELDLIMDLLHEAGDRVDANGQPAFELCHDLMEQSGRSAEIEPTEIEGSKSFLIAEQDFIQRGMDAKEQAKTNSRAAARRNFNLKNQDKRLSKTQTHDVWDANDPRNW
jgi:hypothetical protein